MHTQTAAACARGATAEQTDQDKGLALCLRRHILEDSFGALDKLDGLVVEHGRHTRLLCNLVRPRIDESLLLIVAALLVSISTAAPWPPLTNFPVVTGPRILSVCSLVKGPVTCVLILNAVCRYRHDRATLALVTCKTKTMPAHRLRKHALRLQCVGTGADANCVMPVACCLVRAHARASASTMWQPEGLECH